MNLLDEDSVCGCVEKQVIATPDALALLSDQGNLTYRALWSRVLQISSELQSRGLAAEQPVAVMLPRCPDLLAALLAVWHAGGAYVPIDPDDPMPRSRHILRSSDCRVLVADPHRAQVQADVLALAETIDLVDLSNLDSRLRTPTRVPVKHSDLAYILFTSGSTGVPKGVEIEQGSVLNLLDCVLELLEFGAADRYLATSTVGFDISVVELFLPLVCGASLLLRNREIWLRPRDLAQEIVTNKVTVVQTGPSAWAAALSEVECFPHLRVAISTAEALTTTVAEQLCKIGDAAWNLYGPTEATVWATAKRLPQVDGPNQETQIDNIGQPLTNVRVKLLGSEGGWVLPGERGELCIGGIGLARGYLGDPSRTAAQFITKDGQRWYRSGDVAWQGNDGDVHCLGRLDHQIKIRGVRIEPGEVEVALLAHPAITSCIVTRYVSPAGLSSVGAAVVVSGDQTIRDEELVAWLSERLPSQFVPARWLRLDALPLTASGKADRRTLRDRLESGWRADMRNSKGLATAFASTTEAEIAATWGNILGQTALNREDHFFSVGGDSLAAVRMIARLESRFDVVLGTQSAFEAPTIKRLAALIEHVQAQGRNDLNCEFVFPVTEQGHGLPLFFCEPDMKMVSDGRWGVPCPLFAITTWAQGAGFLQAISLEALARAQLAAVRKHQPVGPYRLAGKSFGGLIALEMAQQLLQLGEEVELLFLLDPLPFARIAKEVTAATHHARAQLPYKNRLWRLARNKPGWQQLLYAMAHLFDRKPNPMAAALLTEDQWPAFWYHAKDLAVNYVGKPYLGRSLTVLSSPVFERGGWDSLLSADTTLLCVDAAPDHWYEEPVIGQWMSGLREAILNLE